MKLRHYFIVGVLAGFLAVAMGQTFRACSPVVAVRHD